MPNFFLALAVYAAAANLVSLAMVAVDKNRSIAGRRRIPEVYFFFWSLFFSSLGMLVGMFWFRHKTRKLYFPLGIGLVLAGQILLIFFLFSKTQWK